LKINMGFFILVILLITYAPVPNETAQTSLASLFVTGYINWNSFKTMSTYTYTAHNNL
jgi:hypothetical protein